MGNWIRWMLSVVSIILITASLAENITHPVFYNAVMLLCLMLTEVEFHLHVCVSTLLEHMWHI